MAGQARPAHDEGTAAVVELFLKAARALAPPNCLPQPGATTAEEAPAAVAPNAPPYTAGQAAIVAASAEGLSLVRAETPTGFKGVVRFNNNNRRKPFQARWDDNGRKTSLGMFATAEEAALAVARHLGPEGVRRALGSTAMTPAEAHATAEAEGLTLLPSATSSTGFKYVSKQARKRKPFKAQLMCDGRRHSMGYFQTAEEASLAAARFLKDSGGSGRPGNKMPTARGRRS